MQPKIGPSKKREIPDLTIINLLGLICKTSLFSVMILMKFCQATLDSLDETLGKTLTTISIAHRLTTILNSDMCLGGRHDGMRG